MASFFCVLDFQVVQLMMLDCKRAVPLLLQNKDLITPSEVVTQLLDARKKCDSRYFLHLYLHSLFEVNPHAGKDYHDMQVLTMDETGLVVPMVLIIYYIQGSLEIGARLDQRFKPTIQKMNSNFCLKKTVKV